MGEILLFIFDLLIVFVVAGHIIVSYKNRL
jgi:hypothetical protein